MNGHKFIFYHCNCNDGSAGAYLLKRIIGNDCKLVGVSPTTKNTIPLEVVRENDEIFFVDITPNNETLDKLLYVAKTANITIYDHHFIEICDLLKKNIKMYVDIKTSAVGIVWNIHYKCEMPDILKAIVSIDMMETMENSVKSELLLEIAVYNVYGKSDYTPNYWENVDIFMKIEDTVYNEVDKLSNLRINQIIKLAKIVKSTAQIITNPLDSCSNIIRIYENECNGDPVFIAITLLRYDESHTVAIVKNNKKSVSVRLLSNVTDCVSLAKYYAGDKGGGHKKCAGFLLKNAEVNTKLLQLLNK